MCIVVDTNSMASVFRPKTQDHLDFKPIFDWIIEGKGKLVIGGTDYEKEISGFLNLLANLSKVKKVVRISCEKVDAEKIRVEKLIDHKDYDDPHVVALISVSKCKLLCSKDRRAHPFFKKRELYTNGLIPSIYSNGSHRHLLNDNNLIEICLPCIKLRKEEIIKFK